MASEIIHVAVGAIVNSDDEVLISKRATDTHQGGLWEFPGGKVEAGETVAQALSRELKEELGISPTRKHPLIKITHHYTDRSVCLDVHKITAFDGKPEGLEGQPVKWQAIDSLVANEFPAADVPIIKALKLPDRYLITGNFNSPEDFSLRLKKALDDGIRLVQLRLKADYLSANENNINTLIQQASDLCGNASARLMLNMPAYFNTDIYHDGIHADSRQLHALSVRPECGWFSVSCHTMDDLEKAKQLNADFAVLSPVQLTNSHPDTKPLGWDDFQTMLQQVDIPVYALGGVDGSNIDQAQLAGAQGVAGISAFWRAG